MGKGTDWKVRLGIDGVANVMTGFNSVLQLFDRAWDAVQRISSAVEQYTSVTTAHRVSVDEASRAVRQQVDVIDLHRAAVRAEQAALRLNESQFRAMIVAATQFADRMGTDVRQEIESLTTAIASGSTEALRRYGIHMRETGDTARTQSIMIEEMTRRFGDQTVEVTSLDDSMVRLRNTWNHAWQSMASVLEQEAGGIMRIINDVADRLEDAANALDTLARSRRALDVRAQHGDLEAERAQIERRLRDLGYNPVSGRMTAPQTFGGMARVAGEILTGPAQLVAGAVGENPAALQFQTGEIQRELARLRDVERRMAENPNWAVEAEERMRAAGIDPNRAGSPPPPEPPRRAGGPPRQFRPISMEQMLRELHATETGFGVFPKPGGGGFQAEMQAVELWAAAVVERKDEIVEAVRLAREAEQQGLEQGKEIEEEQRDRRTRQLEEEADRWRELKDAIDETNETMEQARWDAVTGGLLATADAMSLVGDMAEQMAGKHSRAAQIIGAVEGGIRTLYHGAMIVSEIAEAASDFAKGLPGIPEGIAHLAAATAHGVAVAQWAANLGGGGGGKGAGAAATPSAPSGANAPGRGARPEYMRSEDNRPEELGGPSVVVEVHGVITSARAVREIEAALRDANRRRR